MQSYADPETHVAAPLPLPRRTPASTEPDIVASMSKMSLRVDTDTATTRNAGFIMGESCVGYKLRTDSPQGSLDDCVGLLHRIQRALRDMSGAYEECLDQISRAADPAYAKSDFSVELALTINTQNGGGRDGCYCKEVRRL